MGRIILLALVIVAVVLLWKAFGPRTWKNRAVGGAQAPQIKGPDDDPDFLWNIEKQRFKERRAREEAERRRAEREREQKERRRRNGADDPDPEGPGST
ncbi:hypothetical protein [Corynebacterium mastitidis]|uniref:hypothetical protein n=1 Tax=Corynebacterium mastitidis TaxID=161890 RepID=UPI000364C741|nr:hypothetical protein [Corynebacterium mastitidis]